MFREIGLADELGSGMRNTNKYTKLYSGGTPVFEEGDVFRITIPMDGVAELQVGPDKVMEPEIYGEVTKEMNKEVDFGILELMKQQPEISAERLAKYLEISTESVRYRIKKLKREGLIEHVGSTKKGHWIVK